METGVGFPAPNLSHIGRRLMAEKKKTVKKASSEKSKVEKIASDLEDLKGVVARLKARIIRQFGEA